MRLHTSAGALVVAPCALALFGAVAIPTGSAGAADDASRQSESVRTAVTRGLTFLESDALAWRKVHPCATCHQGVMTIWALNDARKRGLAVNAKNLAELDKWTRNQLILDPTTPVDPRPGYDIVNMAGLYLSAAARIEPDLSSVSSADLAKIALFTAKRQRPEGYSVGGFPEGGLPPVFESRQVTTMWASIAMEPAAQGASEPESVRAARDKAAAWLGATEVADSAQSAALRLLLDVRAGRSGQTLRLDAERVLTHQNADGGWSPTRDLKSDAYATGQALYVLGIAAPGAYPTEVQRGAAFLVDSQRPNGSWPMTSRGTKLHPPSKTPSPIEHIGTAWAALGLMRSIPSKTIATQAGQRAQATYGEPASRREAAATH